jgi:acyl carrier protein
MITPSVDKNNNKATIEQWLKIQVAKYVKLSPEEIFSDVLLAEYGLDSVYALTLSGDIEEHLEIILDPTFMWDNPTISALSQSLRKITSVEKTIIAS